MIYIYLDESGNLGYSNKSSKYFLIAMLSTRNHKSIDNCIKRIRQRKLKKKFKEIPELKFNNSDEIIRKSVLKCIANKEANIYYILLDKRKVSDKSATTKTEFYTYLTGFLISQILEEKENIELIVDKPLSREKREEFNEYIKEKIIDKLKSKVNIRVEHKDSKEDKCIQAVDFISGAIFSKYEFNNELYFNIIQNRIKQEVIFHEEK